MDGIEEHGYETDSEDRIEELVRRVAALGAALVEAEQKSDFWCGQAAVRGKERDKLHDTIARAIEQIENAYDVPPVVELANAGSKGFDSTLECLIHEIWKSDPRVEKIEAEIARLKEEQHAPEAAREGRG